MAPDFSVALVGYAEAVAAALAGAGRLACVVEPDEALASRARAAHPTTPVVPALPPGEAVVVVAASRLAAAVVDAVAGDRSVILLPAEAPLDEVRGLLHLPPPRPAVAAGVHIHPTAVVDGEVAIGTGTRVWHFSKLLGPLTIGEDCILGQNVVVERGVTIGRNVKIQNNVSVYSGVILEDDVFCGPSMVFTNVGTPRSAHPRRGQYVTTRVGQGASIGANATVVCGHTLGRYSFVGAGAVVTRDVPDYGLVYGNPARLRGWACFCGERLPMGVDVQQSEAATCAECGRQYAREGHAVREITP